MRRNVLKTVDLTEYESCGISFEELSFLREKDLEKFLDTQFGRLVRIVPNHRESTIQFKAESRVGAIETKGLRVQVKPRISADEFCILIRYAISGKTPSDHFRSTADLTWDTGFEDALAMLLCDECKEIIRVGVSRKYEERRKPVEVLRGRPLWGKNFPWRGNLAKKIVCRFNKLTYDNPDNQLLVLGLRRAALLSSNHEIKQQVFRFINAFSGLASEAAVDFAMFDKIENTYNRLSEHYRTAHGISKMLVFGLRKKFMFEEGSQITAGCVLDMADLFEKFVERFVTEVLMPDGYNIRPQTSDHRALLDAHGKRYAAIRPDLEIWKNERPVGVIDAKYKPYWRATDFNGIPERKISNADLYQLFFYQQRMMRKHSLMYQPKAVIASPLPDPDERNATEILSDRYKRITWSAGVEPAGNVHLALIPITGFLRMLKHNISAGEAVKALAINDVADIFQSGRTYEGPMAVK